MGGGSDFTAQFKLERQRRRKAPSQDGRDEEKGNGRCSRVGWLNFHSPFGVGEL